MNQTYKRTSPEGNNTSVRSIWTKEEDELLTQLVSTYNGKKWDLVAQSISSERRKKTAKQCRERWHTRLNPAICSEAWKKEEENKLLELHKLLGNRWSEIADKLPGRTDNAVKNWFFCRLRKLLRCVKNASIEVNLSDTTDVEQLAYLLNYLYMFYISPEHEKNMQKLVCARIIGRTNQGDRYLRNMISGDSSIIFCFQKYIEFLLLNLPSSTCKILIAKYPQIFETKAITSNTFSNVSSPDFLENPIFSNSLVEFIEFKVKSSPPSAKPELTLPCPPLKVSTADTSLSSDLGIDSDFTPSFNFSTYASLILAHRL